MERVFLVAIVWAIGCGRIGFDTHVIGDGSVVDGSTDPEAACTRTVAVGRRVYVDDTTGMDGNDGSPTTPVKTVTRAHELAVSGDSIIVRPGNYLGEPNSEIIITKSGLQLLSETTYRAKLPRVTCQACSNLLVEGFEIGGADDTAVQMNVASNITIRNNIIHGSNTAGVRAAGDIINGVIEANAIYDHPNALVHGNSDAQLVIRNNILFDTMPQENFPLMWLEGVTQTLVSGNVIFHGMHPIVDYGAVSMGTVDRLIIENNVIGPMDPGITVDGAIGLDDADGTATIRHNTFVGPFPGAVFALGRNAGTFGPAQFTVEANVWASPTATAQTFSNTTEADREGFDLRRNLYHNGTALMFAEGAGVYGPTDDTLAIAGDPQLPAPQSLTLPVLVGGALADGSASVCEARLALIENIAKIPTTSPAVGASVSAPPTVDARGKLRSDPAALGAYEP